MSGAANNAKQIGKRVFEFGDTFFGHKEGIIVVIEIYLDESGTHHDSQIISVAAAWADRDTWSKWTYDWILAKPPIGVFHSVDCHNRSGEFKGWTRGGRDRYVREKILPTIRNHYIRGVIAAVDKRALANRLKQKHDMAIIADEFVRGWYYICLRWAIRAALEDIKESGVRQVAIVHEENQYDATAQFAYKDTIAVMDGVETTFSMGRKITYPPLQCADLLAYEGNHQMRDFSKPLRKPLRAIDPIGTRFSFRKYDAGDVDKIVDFTASYLKRVASELAQ